MSDPNDSVTPLTLDRSKRLPKPKIRYCSIPRSNRKAPDIVSKRSYANRGAKIQAVRNLPDPILNQLKRMRGDVSLQ